MPSSPPAIVLVRPQMGENIGAAARAMMNFGLTDMRIVAPRDGWPNPAAETMAAGASSILAEARLFDTAAEAVADLAHLWATTARQRYMLKPSHTPRHAAGLMHMGARHEEASGILFGPERTGLENDEVALAHAVLNVPANPEMNSLNLAQAVLLIGYEWFQAADETPGETLREGKTHPANAEELEGFFEHLIGELDTCGFLRNQQHRPIMVRNIRNMFLRAGLFEQEVRTLRGIVSCLVNGRRPLPRDDGEGT
ncbi:MAG: RNA methyltransferase [Pseudomonadota bacterium]